MSKEWKYKIGSGKAPVILIFLMSCLFGGLTLWLYRINNRAVIFTGIFTALIVLVLILTIYRLLFYKVLISDEGFYYQTGIRNGKYYTYTNVEKAWISSGRSQNGGQGEYCNIALYNKRVMRFPFFYNDEKSVDYLIKRANADTRSIRTNTLKEKDDYLIDGKFFGKTRIVLGIVILAVLAFIDVFLIREIGFNFIIIPSIAMAVAVALLLFNYHLFFQVKIGKDSFYCQTTPFNGNCYKYSEIADCRKIKRVVRHGGYGNGSLHRKYYFYFEFTDNKGKKHKFQYEQQIHEYEVNVLKERIETSKG
ncbi:hypothetical protein [Frisingicoccus sp.]|uniref:hypothetical protein n=1 Tax=Frisingicoccus sp. TaxID=1918627 RepID=UPI0015AA4807